MTKAKKSRAKRAKRAKRREQFVTGRVYYDATDLPAKIGPEWSTDFPDRVFAGVAKLVPMSRDVDGHAERMRAHMARVARADVKGNASDLTCDACGTVAPRKGNMRVNPDVYRTPREKTEAAGRWACRGANGEREMYCRACFDVWGWPDEYAKRVRALEKRRQKAIRSRGA